ncbi:MAG: O-methyltransferase [Bacteroidetes bacterium]|nr:O-methyltransferase [Bacteroidota bacterium]MBK8144373.1 O-methyltransferase [Bacteroidota bacterium]MBP6315642.1 O-methyltransferase [Chitinophagaceae bacterium]
MHHLTSEEIHKYAELYTSKESELLYDLNRQTHLQTELPIMLSGHLQGRLLSMISKMIRPRCILEIGTFTGYSALCLAEGLASEGKLLTIESNQEQAALAQEYFNKSPYKDQISLIVGKASDVLQYLNYEYDLVFIDADKMNYSNYFDLVIEKMASGAYILADNVLYNAEVLDAESGSKNAKAMHQYNIKMSLDNRLENVLLPVRDGIMLSRKK